MRAIPRSEIGRESWDALAEASRDAWLWHTWDLQDAVAEMRPSTECGFGLEHDGSLIAIVPLKGLRARRTRIPVSELDSFGGPAVIDGLPGKLRRRALAECTDAMLERARSERAIEVRAALTPLSPALRDPAAPRVNPLLELGFANALTQTWLVDLRPGHEAVWAGLATRARTAVRKAVKEGVSVREADRPGDVDIYYALHQETYERTGARPHPRAYFGAIWERFVGTGRAFALLAEHQGSPVAGGTFAIWKAASGYWTGANSWRGLTIGASNLLQWRAMELALEAKCDWFDNGEAFPGTRSEKLAGLSSFKQSFGGRLYPLYRGRIEMPGRRFAALRAIQRLRSIA